MIREIITPKEDTLYLKIPNQYVNHKIEVLAFPIHESDEFDENHLKDKAIEFGHSHKSYDLEWSKNKLNRGEMNER